MAGKKIKLWKKIVCTILVIILVLGTIGYFAIRRLLYQPPIKSAKGNEKTVVQLNDGKIRGSIEEDVYQYLGVPYAKANERFVPAQDVDKWDGVLDATSTGAKSPQSGMLGMSAGNQKGTDNNCQNLNIWTPGLNDGKKRAVMVWLHGGGFSTGSANDELYNGKDLSKKKDVVVVSVNHRLGTAGFLDLSAYDEKYKYSENVGLTDIVKSLEWIHNNIEMFGGDPDNVTLFGQSGGGAKVLAMMTSPYAKGLFKRGIVESGATDTMGVTFSSKEASTYLTKTILNELGISGNEVEKLQSIDWDEIEKASQDALQITADKFKIPAPLSSGYAMEWGPVIDGDYMPSNPVTDESFAENGKDVELLIGSNLNEWTGMMGGNQGKLTDEEIQAFKEAYPTKNVNKANMVDTLIRLPMLKIMDHKVAQKGANVYAYVFTWNNSMRGAYHGAEIPFVFAHNQNNSDEQKLADIISKAWTNFAKTGVPSADGMPEWEAYDKEKSATMLLDVEPTLVYGHDKKLMNLLEPDYMDDVMK